jgi:hypothetical protein
LAAAAVAALGPLEVPQLVQPQAQVVLVLTLGRLGPVQQAQVHRVITQVAAVQAQRLELLELVV